MIRRKRKRPAQEQEPKCWAKLVSLNSSVKDTDVFGDRFVVGKSTVCDLSINSTFLSRKHFAITRHATSADDANQAYVCDTSLNGTLVNGTAIQKDVEYPLLSGDVITIPAEKLNSQALSFIYVNEEEVARETEEGGPQRKYHIFQSIGSGEFASVRLAINKETKENFALKVIDKRNYFLHSPRTLRNKEEVLMEEMRILSLIDHPHVIRLVETFVTPSRVYMIMELALGGDLFDRFVGNGGPFSEDQARVIFAQVLDAISYLHARGVVHRDLKMENILFLSEGDGTDGGVPHIKITDFGYGAFVVDGMSTVCGTTLYVAPEVLRGRKEKYDQACDLWSLGVMLYFLVVGIPPFDDSSPDVFALIENAEFDFPDEPQLSGEVKDLIRRMICADPQERITADHAKNHPWVKKSSWPWPLGCAIC
mmetsp:Transcript_19771/g.50223  ORF Transcript_19771/g.50223 Transcript_19771/m.50223 type:complete len:423 (-) Transcript_19771:169-1437(-)